MLTVAPISTGIAFVFILLLLLLLIGTKTDFFKSSVLHIVLPSFPHIATIPQKLHAHFHFSITLTRRTRGRILGAYKQSSAVSDIVGSVGREIIYSFFSGWVNIFFHLHYIKAKHRIYNKFPLFCNVRLHHE